MPTPYSFVPALDRKFYPAIGRAIVLWAFLEVEIDWHLSGLLARPDTWKHPLSTKLDKRLPRAFSKRVILWKRLARIHYQTDVLSQARDIISRCKVARTERDRIAHGRWAIGIGWHGVETTYSHVYRDGEVFDEGRPMTTDHITQTSHAIADLIKDLMIFQRDYYPYATPPAPHPSLFQSKPKR